MKKYFRISILMFSLFFIIWVIYMADNNHSSIIFELVRKVPYGDKVGHILLFGILTLVSNVGLNFRRIKLQSNSIYLGTIIISGLVLLEEISQHFIIYRTFDIFDLLADSIGIITFTFLTIFIERKFKK